MGGTMSVQNRTEPVDSLVATIQVLMVRCGSTYLGVPADISHGVLEPDNLDSEDARAGLGLKYPFTDLPGRLGLPASAAGPRTRIVLCARGGAQKAIRIDELFGLTDIEQRRIRSLPPHFTGPERTWFSGLFVFQDDIAFLVNPTWLLRDEADSRLPINPKRARASKSLLAPPPPQPTHGDDACSQAEQPEALN